MKTFEQATFFDCRDDNERLSHEDPSDAISAMLDGQPSSVQMLELIASISPITVYAFARASTVGWAKRAAARLVEELSQEWDEEFGDPEGDSDGITTESGFVGEAEIEAAIEKMLIGTSPFICEPCGQRTYNGAEVERLMRSIHPDWFEEKA